MALFVSGLFGLIVLYANNLSQLIKENIEVQVYLNKFLPENERIRIHKMLSTKPYVLKKEGLAQIEFISKEDAAKQFIDNTGEDFMSFLGDNPLRDAFTVKVHPDYIDEAQLKEVQVDIQNISGVFEATYSQNMISTINQNIKRISLFLMGVAAILIITVIVLINNTIKLALFSQRFLIRSMQLVGATTGFIRKPFLIRAFFYGILGGVLASGLLWGMIHYGETKIEELALIRNNEQIYLLMGGLLILGSLLSLISTYQAMKKYMRLSLDELY
ncbi:cell division protein FtsX [Shiella aurantiaca]|nr:permease-like cell division protein FtsX [Shiella aurantiaca]